MDRHDELAEARAEARAEKRYTKAERCMVNARKGTGMGVCDEVLKDGVCPKSRHHLDYLVPEVGFMTTDEFLDWQERNERRIFGSD